MIKTITVQAGQDLFDIALQELGAIDGVFELANLNGINVLTDTISAGSLLKIDTDKIVNQEVVDTFKTKAITPSTPNYMADAKPDYLRSIRSKMPLAGAKISFGSYIIDNNIILTPSDGTNLTSFTLQLFGNFTQLIANDWLIDKVQEYSVIITDDTVPVLALHIQGSDNEDYYYKSEIGLDKFEGNNLITITVDVVLHLTSFYLDGELINAVNQNLPTNITNGVGSTLYIGEEADTYYYLYQFCIFAKCLDADIISDIWNYGRPDLVAYGNDLSTVLNLSGINATAKSWKDLANNFLAVNENLYESVELLTINPVLSGSEGKGISSTSYDAETGILTVTFTDATTYETGNLRGAAGDKGAAGKGISSTSYNASTGVLTINFTDSSSYQTGDLRGAAGNNGAAGKGISSTSYNASTGVLTINFTDSSSYQTGDLRGAAGNNGAAGKGISSTSYNASTGVLTINFTDSSSYQTGDLRGAAGAPGASYGGVGTSVNGMGAVCITGIINYIVVPFACTITGWSISCDGASPTCTFDIWKIASGTDLPTVSNSIINTGTGGAKPALAYGNVIESSTIAHWTTALAAGDIIAFNLDACTVATKISLVLNITKS